MIIYSCFNTLTGKYYIGQTKHALDRRIRAHVNDSKKSDSKSKFHLALKKYGLEVFVISVLTTCNTQEETDLAEQYWIQFFNTREDSCGYNIAKGGLTHFSPLHHSLETKQKLSKIHKGKIISDEHKSAISMWSSKKKLSEKHKTKFTTLGMKFSDDHKAKISRLGAKHSEEAKKLMSETRRGKKHSEETKRKIRESLLGCNNPSWGKKLSEETKAMLRVANLGKNPRLNAKLTEADVRFIRDYYSNNFSEESLLFLCEKFFVKKSTIRNIIERKTWKNVL